MAYETKDNTGALFANKDRKSDKHANATGNATIDGVAYFVDAWTNTDRNGNKYQSLKFKRKDQQHRQERHQSNAHSRDYEGEMYGRGEDDGEVPW